MSNKKRAQNFSNLEELFIVESVYKNRKIIENKKLDAESWKEKKQCWEEIAREHEIKFGTKRSPKSIREKYDNLKKKTKKIFRCAKSHQLSQTQEQLVALMGVRATGFENIDCDMLGSNADFTVGESEKSSLLGEELNNSEIENSMIYLNVGEDELIPDLEKTNIDAKQSWSTWNPTQFKRKKHEKLIVKKQSDIILLEAQKTYFINEEKRAAEKHEFEMKRAAEKHECEMEQERLKIEILKAELEIKKRNM